MAAWIHDQVKAEIRDIIYGAVETVVREKYPSEFHIDSDDFSQFLRNVRVKRIESDGECSVPGQSSGQQSHRGHHVIHSHRVHLSVETGSCIRFCPKPPAGRGARALRGAVSGMCWGALIGSGVYAPRNSADVRVESSVETVVGSIVPMVGTITVASAIGGVVGGVGSLLFGGGAGTVAGADAGRVDVENMFVESVEVFKKFEDFSSSGSDNDCCQNSCFCTVTGNTTCPYQAKKNE